MTSFLPSLTLELAHRESGKKVHALKVEILRPRAQLNPDANPGSPQAALLGELGSHYLTVTAPRDPTQENLASFFDLSPRQCQRIVSAYLGLAAHRYLSDLRLAESVFLLASPELQIKEIAYHLGYRGQRRYCERFRSRFRLCPGEVRKILLARFGPLPWAADPILKQLLEFREHEDEIIASLKSRLKMPTLVVPE